MTGTEDVLEQLSEDEADFVRVVRRFVDQDVIPEVHDIEARNEYPAAFIDTMKKLGVYGMQIPADYSDSTSSTACFALVTEELARGWMSLAGAVGGHAVMGFIINAFGTEEQRDRLLPAMSTGELRAAMALTEPQGGSDLQAIRTVAKQVEGAICSTAPRCGLPTPGTRECWEFCARRTLQQTRAIVESAFSSCRQTRRESPSLEICRSWGIGVSKAAKWCSTTPSCLPSISSAQKRATGSHK